MSLLIESWYSQPVQQAEARWPFCRSYPSLDDPTTGKVTRIITDPVTKQTREFTASEYIVDPKDISQRMSDKLMAKCICLAVLFLIIATITTVAIYIRMQKPTMKI